MDWLPVLAAQSAYVIAFVLPKMGLMPDFLDNLGSSKILVGALVKAAPLFILGMFTLHHSSRAVTASTKSAVTYIAYGLVLGGMGDIFLDLSVQNENHFLVGLVAFLVGHIWYLVSFASLKIRHSALKFLPFLAYTAAFFYILYPNLLKPKDMRGAVFVYGTVLGLMGYFASIRTSVPAANYWLTAAGAVIFVASDSILAIDKFQSPLPYAKLWVMLTYYTAQNLTAAAVPSLVEMDITAAHKRTADTNTQKPAKNEDEDERLKAPVSSSKSESKRGRSRKQ